MSALFEPRRPRLLPQNRKLRHLKGLSMRNLSFAQTPARTPDAVLLNQTAKKLSVLSEIGELSSSPSSESLHHEDRENQESSEDDVCSNRPRLQESRRESLTFAHISPTMRQRKLESLVEDVVGDVFFSLHVGDVEEPVYISEVREKATNFNFQFFDLADQSPFVSRSCRVIVRFWAKRPTSSWIFLLEELIDLRELNFIGTLRDRNFPPNALIFHLQDGAYSLDFPGTELEPKQAAPVATSTYNALMKLANLENSIEDAIETQQKIMNQINKILEENTAVEPDTANENLSLAQKYVAMQRRTNRQATKERDDWRESLRRRRAAILRGREVQEQVEKDMADQAERLKASQELVEQTQRQIRGQRRRICSELTNIFPITSIPNEPPLSFQICNIPLPNSVYDASTARVLNEDVLSAGLGLVALLIYHLQFYLSRPLLYPLTSFGSRSHVKDPISRLAKDQASRRDFPLYLPRGGSTAGQWRFEYAWFLLNKNIETLCASQGLKVVDIRHTLPNLKYLLYVCSAGTDEVPARKKGGVRGLWAGRLKGRLSSLSSSLVADGETSSFGGSRRGSFDSDMLSQQWESPKNGFHNKNAACNVNGKTSEDGVSPATGSTEENHHHQNHHHHHNGELNLPFEEGETKFTLRTKGLRENVAAK